MAKKYFRNLLQRAEATQFNPCFHVKEFSNNLKLAEQRWHWKTSEDDPSEMRGFIDFAMNRQNKTGLK